MLQVLMVLRLGRVLVLGMLLKIVQHVGHPTARPIQPSIMPLLMVLGVHAVYDADKLSARGEVRELTGTGLAAGAGLFAMPARFGGEKKKTVAFTQLARSSICYRFGSPERGARKLSNSCPKLDDFGGASRMSRGTRWGMWLAYAHGLELSTSRACAWMRTRGCRLGDGARTLNATINFGSDEEVRLVESRSGR